MWYALTAGSILPNWLNLGSQDENTGMSLKAATLNPRIAVFTGMFDPMTLGHLDVIKRGRRLFDQLIVGIGNNPNKQAMFTVEERVALAEKIVSPYANVTVQAFEGLAVHYLNSIGAGVILRGVRTLSDMEYEFAMSLTNARLDSRIETVFLMADGEYSHVSSSLIRQIASLGGGDSLGLFVPPECIDPILNKSRT